MLKFTMNKNTRIGICTPSNLLSNNLQIVGEILPYLVKPHGGNCSCKMTNQYGIGLGCPNPSTKISIK